MNIEELKKRLSDADSAILDVIISLQDDDGEDAQFTPELIRIHTELDDLSTDILIAKGYKWTR